MPTRKYALEPAGIERLELSWKGLYQDFTVSLDNAPIGTIPNQGALTEPNQFKLPDGSLLEVQLLRKWTGSELQVLRDGRPLPGSATDPATRVKLAAVVVYIIAGLNILLGGLAFLGVDFFQTLAGDGVYALLFGGVFLILGTLVNRHSQWALFLAIGLYILDWLLGVIASAEAGADLDASGTLIRAIILLPLFQGIGALRALKRQAAADKQLF